jgi:RNA polymerase sigma factor (sigma-70 family)
MRKAMMPMIEQDRQIADLLASEKSRLRRFIRRRVPNESDVEDLIQEVFFELVRAHRLLQPIDSAVGWLYGAARNRIADLFRKEHSEGVPELSDEDGAPLTIVDLLPSPGAGPDAVYLRNLLFDELAKALAELPAEQRLVFVAHEFDGISFAELAAETGVNLNTLLARKRYAVLHRCLATVRQEFTQSSRRSVSGKRGNP